MFGPVWDRGTSSLGSRVMSALACFTCKGGVWVSAPVSRLACAICANFGIIADGHASPV